MHKDDQNNYVFSPSDLSAFLSCPHTALLNRLFCDNHLLEDDKTKVVGNNKWLEHEKNILNQHKKDGKNIVKITQSKYVSLNDKANQTKDNMFKGVDIIYQGTFLDAPWCGRLDFLRKCDDNPSDLGNHIYEVIDAKSISAKSFEAVKQACIIQLCAYADMVKKIQGVLPRHIYIILNDDEKIFKTNDFFSCYLKIKQRFEHLMNEFPEEKDQIFKKTPVLCQHCEFCDWQNFCADKRKAP